MITSSVRAVPVETDAASFQVVRPRLFGIACRMLGSANDADDVVQDAWIRWQGTDRGQIRDPAGFSSR
jgi:RNA polymerase sigma-70 factor, ECF subfamily